MSCPYCHPHCPSDEPTTQDLIKLGERGDWKPLDSSFGGYQESGRPIILYEMLKALLEKAK